MKLVRMPRHLLAVEPEDLPGLGVAPGLAAAVAALAGGDPDAIPSLAILGPREAGTTPALMLLARRVGARLRDDNIRLRDSGGDLAAGRKALCYLPGADLAAALARPDARRALHAEAAVFVQDLDDSGRASDGEVCALVAARRERRLRTFVSADPGRLSPRLLSALAANLAVVRADGSPAAPSGPPVPTEGDGPSV
jgi:hypothetical protein